MNIRRCVLVVGLMAGILLIAWATGVFQLSALAPSRVLEGSTRSFIALAILLVGAMTIAWTCRRDPDDGPFAKTDTEPRNKTTR